MGLTERTGERRDRAGECRASEGWTGNGMSDAVADCHCGSHLRAVRGRAVCVVFEQRELHSVRMQQ